MPQLYRLFFASISILFIPLFSLAQAAPAVATASFTAPDTVCINKPVTITNTSMGASSYFWNFCVADIDKAPVANNIGNPGGQLSRPVFMDYAFANGNYYGFTTNFEPGGLVRLDFGNSLLNAPTAVNLGNFGGIIPPVNGGEGLQVVQNEGKWYVIMVGGNPNVPGGVPPRILKIELGLNIANPAPTATDWGNLGNMLQPIDLHLFKEGNNWYGFTVNSENNTITRFNFTNSFNNTPTALNLGNIGSLSYPTGIYAISDNGNYRVFITNGGDNSRSASGNFSLTRLDFGSSLLNVPTGVNLGNPGNVLRHPRDLTIMRSCDQVIAFAVNGAVGADGIVKFNFNNDLSSVPTGSLLGNLGNLNFPHSISRLFRVNEDIYGFVTNVSNNTITRLRFPGCANASIASSAAQTPPPVVYNAPGTYNINLTVDDGLPTQAAFCKQVVVMPAPVSAPTQPIRLCTETGTVKIGTATKHAQYVWNTGATTDSIDVTAPGKYWVDINVFGCTATDTFMVNARSCTVTASFTAPDTVCISNPVTVTNTSVNATTFFWNFCTGNLNNPPVGANLGNFGGIPTSPVYIDYVQENGNYYGFMTDNYTGRLFRLDFGNNLLNTPVMTNLGTLGGVIPASVEGIQIIRNEGKWYAILVGGEPAISVAPFIIKVELGTNITNPAPVATNWGNLGNMQYPHDLYVFNDGPRWFGLTVNTNNNTITRFDFTNSFDNTPTAVNLGNIGNMVGPTGIHAINDNGNWYAFVTNANGNTITRLNFGNSLLNVPVGTNLGNLNGTLHTPWDIYVIKYCGDLLAYVINADGSYNSLVKLDFQNSIVNNAPAVTDFGNIGNMNFPHCLSKIFRAGADLYTFVPNVLNQTLSRIRFPGCTNASLPNFTAQDPPPIVYNTPGTYNINLTVDDGLPTQTAFCKQVVVLPAPVPAVTQQVKLCNAIGTVRIGTGTQHGKYLWNTGATTDSIDVMTPGKYWVDIDVFGCKVTDTMVVRASACIVTASFTAPDTVCVNNPVNIINTSIEATTYFWNFCVADITAAPAGTNLGNPGVNLSEPVFMDYVKVNNNYYGFVVNHRPGGLVRLDFGNSLLNTPTSVNLGNFGGIIPANYGAEGIRVVQNNGKWYAIIVGGATAQGYIPRILKVDFGANITNPAPAATNWGNLGTMEQPIDFDLFEENGNWYGFTVNAINNTFTRFNFGNSFDNTPTAVNMGNLGGLNYPTGIFIVNDEGSYRVFISNAGGSASLTRLDFGNSLLNTPTAVNLGNPGNVMVTPRDLTVMRSCGQAVAFIANGRPGYGNISQLNFNNDLTSVPVAASLGNIGSLDFAHSISRLFRVKEDIYGFVTNVTNNSITRIRFPGCTNASIPSSSDENPPPIIYSTPGTYNINLTVDDGLPTQTAFCKQVVVLPAPVQQPTQEVTICMNGPLRIGTNKKHVTYLWNTGAITDSIEVTAPGTYWVEVNSFDCKITDTIKVTVRQVSDFGFKQDMCDPLTVQFFNASAASNDPWWNMGDGTIITGNTAPSHTYAAYGDYTVRFSISDGICADTITKIIPIGVVKDDVVLTPDTIICDGTTKQLRAVQALSYCWYPATYLDNPAAQNPVTSTPQDITYYLYTEVTGSNLIVNGDFSAGNTGFTSQYNYAANNTTEGEYSVGANPRAWNSATSNCRDHTTGSGNMLLVNGNPIAGERVWTQTVQVVPNTSYAFSTWIQSISEANPAQLQFSINGKNMAGVIAATLPGCNWLQFYTTWNSGNSTTAEISVVNINTIRDGNDFALDDISFAPVFIKQDSVVIKVEKPQVKTNKDSVVCKGQTVPLVATGAAAYSWLPATGLSDPAIANPVATVQGLTQYIVTGTTLNGCTAKDTVLLDVFAKPAISKTSDTTVCRNSHFPLYISGGVGYEWAPAGQVDDINSDRPRVTVGTDDVTFQVTITDPNGCAFGDSVVIKIFPDMVSDFAFKQDVCDPRTVQFFNTGSGANAPWWSMGDGTEVTGNIAPQYTYAAEGDYEVQFSVSNGTCVDTISRIIPVRILKENIVLTPDTVICDGTAKQLRSLQALNYCWYPTTFLDNPAAQNPVTSTPQDITYYLHSEITGANLIVNGDFSAGNTGFGSDYQFIPSNYTTIGAYAVHSNPLLWNTWASACTDHTGNNGNMMLMDGAGTPGKRVWYATVAVQPNTNYLLSAWAQSVSTTNFARLRFAVNDRMAGNIYLQLSDPCQWEHFSTTWFSGSQTTATIAIEDFNYNAIGNDFALDDIFFAPVFIKRDSVVVRVEKPVVRTNKDTTVCKEKPVPLLATGAAVYAWSPVIGLSNPAIANPVAIASDGQTEYIVTGTTIHGCVARDTVLVGSFAKPAITRTSDTTACRHASFPLHIAGGTSYTWSPAGQLDNINSDHPVVSVGIDPVTFGVTITDQHACIYQDSVRVAIRPYPVFTATGNKAICEGGNQPLKASGGDVYQWLPAHLLDDPTSPTPVARPAATTPFSVHILESTCGFDTTINMRIAVNPTPVITVDKPHDVNCNTPTVQLKASGGLHYTWSPAGGLDDPNKADPVAAIDVTTPYKVIGTNQYGCSDSATVEVKVSKDGIPRFVTPNAFTPNGDGNNDCFGIRRWGDAVVEEFAVYNRWGQLVFRTNNPAQCWDGTFKGKPQDTGGYVYVIKARTICGVVSTKGVVMLIR